jgi:aldehyde dehydrogenase (NAD+)
MTATLTNRGPQAPSPYGDFSRLPIGGVMRGGRSGTTGTDTNPFDGSRLLDIALCDASDVDEAYRVAEREQPAWAARPPQERAAVIARAAEILRARADEAAGWIVREAGGSHAKAQLEVQLAIGGMLEAASYPARIVGQILPSSVPGMESRVYRMPVGVVCVISPWNFPLQLANRSIAPALACGNAVVVKPATDTPVTGGLFLARVFEEAGLPLGVMSVVVGAGKDIGDAIVEHPVPRVISFTGSTEVGAHLAEVAGRNVKRVCLELGGNAPHVVLGDADLDVAVDSAIFGKFMHQGQICMAINRIVVDDAIYDAFVERFVARARALPCGDPADANTVIGPIINARQLGDIRAKIDKLKASGARLAYEGGIAGNVVRPHVFSDVRNEDAQEEMFGPVAMIVRAHGDDDAVRIANDTRYGLTGSVITRDLERGVAVAKRIDAGMMHVNDSPVNDEPNTAFGGQKASGLGRFGGEWAIREFTTDRWISVQTTPRAYPF